MKRHLFTILFCVFLSTPLLADNLSHWQRMVKKRDHAAEQLTPEELSLAQQRAAKLLEEIQQRK